MKITLRFLMLLLPLLAATVIGFLWTMNRVEKRWVETDLSNRARVMLDSSEDSIDAGLASQKSHALQKLLDRLGRNGRSLGVAICGPSGEMLGSSQAFPKWVSCSDAAKEAEHRLGLRQGADGFFHLAVVHASASPWAMLVVQDPALSFERGIQTRRWAFWAFLALAFLISILTFLVHRWSISRPITQLSKALRALVVRNDRRALGKFKGTDFGPLVENLEGVISQMRLESDANSELRLWNASRLRQEVNRLFGDAKISVIANREPYIHNRKGDKIEVQFPASGLVSALEPIVRACSGLWIGHGSGSADRETADRNGIVHVPPAKPEYSLKRIWLSPEEEEGYYYGFANEGLWALCHIAHTRPLFRLSDWNYYQTVNSKFASSFSEEMKSQRPIALIQDYHFALVPGQLRKMRPDAITSLFWHIPWPNAEAIGICPWKVELLNGMLGANLIGFHTQVHCNNFMDTVDRYLEARVDRSNFSVTLRGHTCFVKPFPIGIEWPSPHQVPAEDIPPLRAELLSELGLPQDTLMGIGVDRLDYTKGIVERFLAVERLLELNPGLVGRFVMVNICAPSRTFIKRYQDLDAEVREVAGRINARFGREGYEPIVLRISHHPPEEVFRYLAVADLCFVSSLHDGMNLVAKEYVAAKTDNSGALLLSSFTGAAREMTDALVVNPYDIEECARALHHALTMDPLERRRRMARLRELVARRNVYQWAGQFMAEIHRIGGIEAPPLSRTRSFLRPHLRASMLA